MMQVLDHGYVTLVEHWGSDQRVIEAARMSTDKGFLGWGPFECTACGAGTSIPRGGLGTGFPVTCKKCKGAETVPGAVMRTLGARLSEGAHVVWLDQVLPMYRKDQFAMDGVIGMVKSTSHRFRVVTIFRKVGECGTAYL